MICLFPLTGAPIVVVVRGGSTIVHKIVHFTVFSIRPGVLPVRSRSHPFTTTFQDDVSTGAEKNHFRCLKISPIPAFADAAAAAAVRLRRGVKTPRDHTLPKPLRSDLFRWT